MEKFINFLAGNPRIFAFLRRVLENNYPAQRKVFSEDFRVSSGEKILDVGCGTGDFSVFFQNAGYTGVDIEPKYIEYAQKKYKGKFLTADAESLPFADNSFDKVIIIAVLHHTNDAEAEKVLAEAKRVLKTSGKALIMEDMQKKDAGFLTKVVHRFDKGKDIRVPEEYRALIKKYFNIEKDFEAQSGLCPYQVFILRKL